MAPDGAVIYDGWIEHDPANAELALMELRTAAATSPAAALRRQEAARPRERGVARRPGDRAAERPGDAPVAGGPAAVPARPRAESRPRMTRLTGNRDAPQLTPTLVGHRRRVAAAPGNDIHHIAVAFSAGRISTDHATAAAARKPRRLIRQNALVTAAHADRPAPGHSWARPRRQPAGIAVGP